MPDSIASYLATTPWIRSLRSLLRANEPSRTALIMRRIPSLNARICCSSSSFFPPTVTPSSSVCTWGSVKVLPSNAAAFQMSSGSDFSRRNSDRLTSDGRMSSKFTVPGRQVIRPVRCSRICSPVNVPPEELALCSARFSAARLAKSAAVIPHFCGGCLSLLIVHHPSVILSANSL